MGIKSDIGYGTVVLLACCGLLVLLIAVEFNLDYRSGQATNERDLLPSIVANLAPPADSVEFPAPGHFRAFIERPLFNESRQPLQIAVNDDASVATVKTPTTPIPQWDLVGVVISGDRQTALFWDKKYRKMHKLRQNEEVSGWKLTDILSDSAVLSSGARRHEFQLRDYLPTTNQPMHRQ